MRHSLSDRGRGRGRDRDTNEHLDPSSSAPSHRQDEYRRRAIEQEKAVFKHIDDSLSNAGSRLKEMETTLDEIYQLSDRIASERINYIQCANFTKNALNSSHTNLQTLKDSTSTVYSYKKVILDWKEQITKYSTLTPFATRLNRDSWNRISTARNDVAFSGYEAALSSRDRIYRENVEHSRKLAEIYRNFLQAEGRQVREGDVRDHVRNLNELISEGEMRQANELLTANAWYFRGNW